MKRLAFYTCYFGGEENYSKLIPPIPSETEDCYFFTNNNDIYKQLENTKWLRIFMNNIPIHNNHVLDTAETKELRACPHRFEILRPYRYLCWFDSKIKVYEDIVHKYVDFLETSEKISVFTKHPYSDVYTNVWDEYNLAINVPKYREQQAQYKAYIELQLSRGCSKTIDVFYCCTFSIRKMCEKTIEMNECWLKNILECGIEDQISFQFVQQLYADSILGLNYQETWKYFYE